VKRFLIAFLAVTGAVVLAGGFFGMQFGRGDYWDRHGFFFLLFITLFPRLTLLLSSVPFGGLFWWLGWLFAPRILVATLATVAYWYQNPILVVIAWLVAVGGESSEKYVVIRRAGGGEGRRGFDQAAWVKTDAK
jgi:hypothetical protein